LPCYDLLREALYRHSDENSLDLKPYAPLLAGSLARSLAVIVCSPLELAKTRMQVTNSSRLCESISQALSESVLCPDSKHADMDVTDIDCVHIHA